MNKTFKFLSPILLFLCSFIFADDSFENKQVGDIKISIENFSDSSSKAGDLLKSLSTQKGALFSQVTFDADLKKLAETFDRIEPNIEVQKDNKVYIDIKLWQRPTIAKIEWYGNEKFKSKKSN